MTQTTIPTEPAAFGANLGGRQRFLTFYLETEEYGLPILQVREIIGVTTITPLPDAPPSVLGVINRRGEIISVIDLRGRLRLPSRPPADESCIIIVMIDGKPIGLLVDRVSEVLEIDEGDIEPPPESGFGTSSLAGIANVDESVRLLLDSTMLFGASKSDDDFFAE